MFDILFGWRKASKCKKLIRSVQCRLKLLKNKRSTIVSQLREDVVELLKRGHGQTAFDRSLLNCTTLVSLADVKVEQLFKDESLVAAYDLLDHFCEFIIINLPYIRRIRDCPNDINEAVSSLIFASARFGDLPELRSIRKLFGERYGQRLATVALELLPGNLVNRQGLGEGNGGFRTPDHYWEEPQSSDQQMKEKVSIKSVPDDVKSRLVEEILGTSLQSGPLLLELEYCSQNQQKLANESSDDPILSAETICERNEVDELQKSNTTREGKIVFVDSSSENNFLKDLSPSLLRSKTTHPSTYSIRVQEAPINTSESSIHDLRLVNSPQKISPCSYKISGLQHSEGALAVYDWALGDKEGRVEVESCSEGTEQLPAQLPEEMIYIEDILEIQSPLSKEGNFQDQRLFKFKSSALPVGGKTHNINDEAPDQDQYDSDNERAASRSFQKSRNIGSSKRPRRRSFSGDATSMNDTQCAIYYGDSYNSSPNDDQKSHYRKKHLPIKQQRKVCYAKEIPAHPPFIRSFSFVGCTDDHTNLSRNKCISNNKMLNNCSLEHPCYFCTWDEEDDWNCSPQKPQVQIEVCHCHCTCNKNPKIQEAGKDQKIQETGNGMLLNQPTNKSVDATSPTLLISTSSGGSSPSTSKEGKPSCTRAMTMPLVRPKDATIDSVLRSNSFPFKGPEYSNRHVHPKLPDYDELVAKFMALKKANLHK